MATYSDKLNFKSRMAKYPCMFNMEHSDYNMAKMKSIKSKIASELKELDSEEETTQKHIFFGVDRV